MVTNSVEKNLSKRMTVAQLVKKFRFYSEVEGSKFLQYGGN
jgi:hypothetical protein